MKEREESAEAAVRQVVDQINDHWLNKRYAGIGELIAEHAIIAPPESAERIRGREAYVQSYRDYDRAATTVEFSPGRPEVDIIGDVAIAVCPFFVVFELAGRVHREQGTDLLVLSRSTDRWRVVWRTMISKPAAEPGR